MSEPTKATTTKPMTFSIILHHVIIHLRISIIRNSIQMLLNLLLRQTPKPPLLPLNARHLNLIPPKITPQHTPQTNNRRPHRLLKRIILNPLHPLFQKIRRLLLLRPGRCPLERQIMPRRIHLENRRSTLLIHPHNHQHTRQGTHRCTLRIHLCQIRHPLGQSSRRNGIPIFKFKIGRLIPHSLYCRMTIGNHARGQYPDLRSNVKHVTDGVRNDETIGNLALSDDYGCVGAAEGDSGEARGGGGGFEGVFHLVEAALGGED
mmetsp:Transcript_25830/g.43882  ORF Transcript_25830/g.43882 Transcript_25830/m.43882 type:complete len:262 (-) Transcript_25830:166-951(-)